MNDTTAVPVLALSQAHDPVEAFNGLLRRAGVAAHCTWIPALQDLADALQQLNPELLVGFDLNEGRVRELAAIRDQVAHMVPLIMVRSAVDERLIARDLAAGARDTVSLGQAERLHAVVSRELRAFRLERTLQATLRASQEYRNQIETVLQRSNDAILQVQEGIIVDANTAWLELLGYAEAAALIGQPAMDLFDEGTQAPLRGALAACLQNRWTDHTIRSTALLADGSTLTVDLLLALGAYDGEPCVRLIVPAQRRDENALPSDLEQAIRQNPGTGLLRRRHLLDAISARLSAPMRGGQRYVAAIRPDRFKNAEKDVGVLGAEELFHAYVQQIRGLLGPQDIAGHLGGTSLLVLLERGNRRDVEAWAEHLVQRIGSTAFQAAGKAARLTCTVGVAVVPHSSTDLNAIAADAIATLARAGEQGGHRVLINEQADTDARVLAYDQVWVRHIRAALLESRFRLTQQPVVSLRGAQQQIFEVAIRMLDVQGKEVLPSEFLPAAQRNDLMMSIDRWVLGASIAFAAKHKPDLLFIRLSKDSALDTSTLLPWLDAQLKTTLHEPQRLCVQVTAELAARYTPQIQALAAQLRARGLRFALEHFSGDAATLPLVKQIELDYLKIDGALMQGLPARPDLQQRVQEIVEAASQHQLLTVAERIEDANTMAVVWQLGVQYIQGYLVHAPEEVILKS